MAVMERAFDRTPGAWDHPGLLHMYIHLMEMSPHPERALRHGDRLTDLVPDAGHLVHMATHIDVLCGEYQNVLHRNLAAAKVDDVFKEYAGAANFYALYRIHNLHFAAYGAMFLGQRTAAIDAARRLREEVPDEVVRAYPDIFETFVAAAPHVYIRFGMWSDILELEQPEDKELYVTTNALIHYAKAVALANLGRHQEAKAAMVDFTAAYAEVPDTRMLFNNTARDVLAVGEEMMKGEIAFKAGRREGGPGNTRKPRRSTGPISDWTANCRARASIRAMSGRFTGCTNAWRGAARPSSFRMSGSCSIRPWPVPTYRSAQAASAVRALPDRSPRQAAKRQDVLRAMT